MIISQLEKKLEQFNLYQSSLTEENENLKNKIFELEREIT